MTIYKLILILICTVPTLCFGQLQDDTVLNFAFEGMKKSKEKFLRRHIINDAKYLKTDSIVAENTQRLLNLPPVLELNKVYGRDTLTYIVKEKKTLIPVLNFGGIRDNFWYQMGVSDYNFRGLGQTILAYYQFNDSRHTAELYFKVPHLKGLKWGYSANYLHWESVEPLFFSEGAVQYNYTNNAFGASLIRNVSYRRTLETSATVFRESYNKLEEQFSDNTPGPESLIQNKFLLSTELATNNLNYNEFYVKDFYWRINYTYVRSAFDKTNFHSGILEMKYFYKYRTKGNFATRLRVGISTNNDSPFAPFVVDSHVNIRGVGNRIDRGTAQVIINLEYRHTIMDIENWAAQFVVFADNGSWRNPGGQLSDLVNQDFFRQFLGAGFRVIFKKIYNAILRIDYGVDVRNLNQRGIVFGASQYF